MDAYEGYCIGKGIKDKEPEKPAADDVRRWKAMIEEAGREDA